MKGRPWLLPIVLLMAYAVSGHIHCTESPVCQLPTDTLIR